MVTGAAPSVELFAYPWDILDRGIARFTDYCRELGIDKLHVTTVYHSGKFFLPRNNTSRVYFPEPGRVHVPLPEGCFGNGMAPPTGRLASSSSWLHELYRAAQDTGLSLAAWTVFHHNSELGGRYPQFTVRNLFGDSYPFALCPSNPEVAEYSLVLARAVGSLGVFDTLDLETIGYLGYFHGHHHEVTAVPAGPLENFILSLCFCHGCRAVGETAGIDMEALGSALRSILLRKVQSDDACSRNPDNFEQLATLIALLPPLQTLLRVRMETISALVRRIRAAADDVKLSIFTSSFVGSPSNIWMEGVCLSEVEDIVDGINLLAYTADADAFNSDLVFCCSLVRDVSKLNVTLTLGLPVTPTLAHAASKISYAWRQGIRRFSFFNYGFLGQGRLDWLKELSAFIHEQKS